MDFLDEYREPLVRAEEAANPNPKTDAATKTVPDSNSADNTLLNTNDELYLRGKGSFVFWMLRDMVGDSAMQSALAAYRPGADKDPAYLQRLLQTSSKRDLEWFFDDWVYRDRGLPDFHVDSAYTRPLLSEAKSFLVTATIENRGRAGAEVPMLVQTPSGEKIMRVLVKAGEKGTGRIEFRSLPTKSWSTTAACRRRIPATTCTTCRRHGRRCHYLSRKTTTKTKTKRIDLCNCILRCSGGSEITKREI